MADLLLKLVQRTLGLAPVAEPLVAPLFAPDPSLPGAAPALADAPLAPPALADAPLINTAAPAVPSVPPAPLPDVVSTGAAPPDVAPAARRAAPPATGASPDAAPILAPRAPARQVKGHPSFHPPIAADAPAQPSIAPPEPLLLPVAPPEAGAFSESPAPAAGAPPGAPPPHPAPEDTPAPSPRAAAETLLVPLEAPALQGETPIRATSGAVAAGLDADPPASPPAPVIEIRIGRVEVRAIQAPAPSQPRPAVSPAPQVSLEEYLRQQNGGKR